MMAAGRVLRVSSTGTGMFFRPGTNLEEMIDDNYFGKLFVAFFWGLPIWNIDLI